MKLRMGIEKHHGDFCLRADFQTDCDRLGVFGRSGSGKSTLVELLAGLQRPDHGRIELDGEALFCSTRGIDLPPQRRRISVVFQHGHLFPHLSVNGNLLYGYQRTPPALRRVDPASLIEVLDLGALLQRRVATLSGGERQRVALGRAVLANPRLLLMDEPLSALDEGLKYRIIPYLAAVREHFSIPFVLVSHALNELRLMTDEVVVLHHGAVTDQLTPDELARKRMGWAKAGYVNLLRLDAPQPADDLFAYRFGSGQLLMWSGSEAAAVFELSSTDIMLFRGRPEAISARNLLACRVEGLIDLENRVGVQLACCGQPLMATVVRQAAAELNLRPGDKIYAVIKASAFRKLY